MVTPLMLLLSSINEEYKYDKVLDLSYLTVADKNCLMAEADRLGKLAANSGRDDQRLLYTTAKSGREIVDPDAQIISGAVVSVHPATAMLLTRIAEAHSVLTKSAATQPLLETYEEEEINIDREIQDIEGRPSKVYDYVYRVMSPQGVDRNTKMRKIIDLYLRITNFSSESVKAATKNDARLLLHSRALFWTEMLTRDWLACGNSMEESFSVRDLDIVKAELRKLGFPGFVNPLEIYRNFGGAVVTRKTEVKVDPSVIMFLDKVIRSGGDA